MMQVMLGECPSAEGIRGKDCVPFSPFIEEVKFPELAQEVLEL